MFIGRTDVLAETPILWPPDGKNWLIWKTMMLGKIVGGRRRGWQRIRWLDGITNSWVWINSGSWWWTGRPGVQQSMGSQRVGHDWTTELNWYIAHIVWKTCKEIYPLKVFFFKEQQQFSKQPFSFIVVSIVFGMNQNICQMQTVLFEGVLRGYLGILDMGIHLEHFGGNLWQL